METAGLDCVDSLGGGNSILFFRHSIRARCRISSLLVAGSTVAVEAWDPLPPLGCTGALWLRRTPVRILSAGVVDVGKPDQQACSVDHRVSRVHLARVGTVRNFDVRSSAAMV